MAPLPPFCKPYATAVVNYRWAGFNPFREPEPPSPDTDGATADYRPIGPLLHWPTPFADVMRAYDWLVQNFAPPESEKRDIFVLGSYLGAPLAASLALTETKPSKPMAVRGFAAYNGIYNWTTFLQDHPVLANPYDPRDPANDPVFQEIALHTEALFDKPAGLFDPFASPCLFLHTPGLQAAPDFHTSVDSTWYSLNFHQREEFWKEDTYRDFTQVAGEAAPRKTAIRWPPPDSDLQLPKCLLLHSRERRQTVPDTPTHHYQFQYHANDLVDQMRRAFCFSPLRTESHWETPQSYDRFIRQCFRTQNVGADTQPYSLPAAAQRAIGTWLNTPITAPPRQPPASKTHSRDNDSSDFDRSRSRFDDWHEGLAACMMKRRG